MEASSSSEPKVKDGSKAQEIVCHLKSQGIFDQFRKECLSDVDTKPSYHNLIQRVGAYSSTYLAQQAWSPDVNKNNLRDNLRKYVNDTPVMVNSLDHLVDQVVLPKAYNRFLSKVVTETQDYLKKTASTNEEGTQEDQMNDKISEGEETKLEKADVLKSSSSTGLTEM